MVQVKSKYGLYPYQQQVLHDLLSILAPDRNRVVSIGPRVVAHLPTGAGKTRLACHVACHTLNLLDSVGKLVIWLASTEELCQQASDDLVEAWSHLGNRTVDIHEFWGNKSTDLTKMHGGFLVAGLPKLWATAKNDHTALNSLANATALVIFDEAHQAIAHTYRFITEQLVTYQPPLLGLTATPGRTAEINDEDQELAELFHFNKVTIDARGHSNPVAYLTTQGFLADPEFTHIETQSELQIQDHIDTPDYSQDDLNQIGEDVGWQQAITETTITALKRYNRVIVFCPSVRNAATCAERINAQGFTAETILGTTPTETRQRTIAKFKEDSREAMAILNYGVLTAGFNAPRTRCVIIGRPTTSLVLYSQMAGRAMRGPRSGGNRTCQIYTITDSNLPAFGSLADEFRNWEKLWRQN